jgi:hypothetical protein
LSADQLIAAALFRAATPELVLLLLARTAGGTDAGAQLPPAVRSWFHKALSHTRSVIHQDSSQRPTEASVSARERSLPSTVPPQPSVRILVHGWGAIPADDQTAAAMLSKVNSDELQANLVQSNLSLTSDGEGKMNGSVVTLVTPSGDAENTKFAHEYDANSKAPQLSLLHLQPLLRAAVDAADLSTRSKGLQRSGGSAGFTPTWRAKPCSYRRLIKMERVRRRQINSALASCKR